MVLLGSGMSRQLVKVGVHYMFHIMKSIRHRSLESSASIFKAKGELTISESPPREIERGFYVGHMEGYLFDYSPKIHP